MTDNEIVKALECCNSEKESLCFECPYHLCSPACLTKRNEDVIDLINRQQAEIERLQKELSAKMPSEEYPFKVKVGNNSEIHSKSIEDYDRLLFDISAETIKEFAKELKSEIVNKPSEFSAEKGTVDFLNGLAHRQHEILNDIDRVINRKAGEG